MLIGFFDVAVDPKITNRNIYSRANRSNVAPSVTIRDRLATAYAARGWGS